MKTASKLNAHIKIYEGFVGRTKLNERNKRTIRNFLQFEKKINITNDNVLMATLTKLFSDISLNDDFQKRFDDQVDHINNNLLSQNVGDFINKLHSIVDNYIENYGENKYNDIVNNELEFKLMHKLVGAILDDRYKYKPLTPKNFEEIDNIKSTIGNVFYSVYPDAFKYISILENEKKIVTFMQQYYNDHHDELDKLPTTLHALKQIAEAYIEHVKNNV